MNSKKRLDHRSSLNCCNRLPRGERGMALLVVLVMLLLVSLIAIVGAEDSQLQTRMSANNQRYEVASYRAETLLIRLEQRLEDSLGDGSWTLSDFKGGAANGFYSLADGSATQLDPLSEESWDKNGKVWGGGGDSEAGRYIIEHLGLVGALPLNSANAELDRRRHAFRITVQGESGGASAVIQSEVQLRAF